VLSNGRPQLQTRSPDNRFARVASRKLRQSRQGSKVSELRQDDGLSGSNSGWLEKRTFRTRGLYVSRLELPCTTDSVRVALIAQDGGGKSGV
jgi:hypothetical protein